MKTSEKIKIIIGSILEVVNIALIILLISHISQFNILPAKFFILLIVLLGLSILIPVITLAARIKSKTMHIISAVLIVLSIIVCSAGVYYMGHGIDTLEKVAAINTKTSTIGVYVNADSDKDGLQSMETIRFGVLADTDSTNTEKAILQIEEELGTSIEVQEYEGIDDLTAAVLNGEEEAIILNEALIGVLADTEEFQNAEEQLKVLAEYNIVDSLKGTSASSKEQVEPGEPFLLYVSGIDVWGHITQTSRSDVNILMAVNPQTRQILLVHTPRDYYVKLSFSDTAYDKLTHAGIYGIDESEAAMKYLYGLDIDHYFKLNFSGFEGLIDALGGITVWSDYDFTVEPIKHYVVGDNELTGLEALAFARERYSFEAGDRQRGINQMNVIQSVIDKISSSAFLTNYEEVLDQIEGTFATDMTMEDIAALVKEQLTNGGEWTVYKWQVDGTEDYQQTYSGGGLSLFVLQPHYEELEYASSLLQKVLDGEDIGAYINDVSAETESVAETNSEEVN